MNEDTENALATLRRRLSEAAYGEEAWQRHIKPIQERLDYQSKQIERLSSDLRQTDFTWLVVVIGVSALALYKSHSWGDSMFGILGLLVGAWGLLKFW